MDVRTMKKPIDYLLEQENADKRYWIKPDEACALIQCGKTTLWKLRSKGLVDSGMDGSRRKYVKASVYAYIAERVGRWRR